jgi:hypothetical protein
VSSAVPANLCTAVVPFPIRRRRTLVCKLAKQMIARSVVAAEKHLSQQLRRQADVLRRKGIAEDRIERELYALEEALRDEVWRLVFGNNLPGTAS